MPKMKSHRGAAKRFKKTGTGKIGYRKKGRRHNLGLKATKNKRQLRGLSILSPAATKLVAPLLPKK